MEGNSHFMMALGRIDSGRAVEVADAQLREVLEAVRRTGKKGTVTVVLEVAPNGEMGFVAKAKVTSKAPDHQFGQSFFFMDRRGNLTREQQTFEELGLMQGEQIDG